MNVLHILLALLGGHTASGGYRRVGYLFVTVVVAAASWLVLSGMTVPFVGGVNVQAKSSGVVVRNGSQTPGALPLSYTRRIENIPGALDVTWMTFQVVKCKSSPIVGAVLLGYGGPGTKFTLMHHGTKNRINAATYARWQSDPVGVLITSKAATACGWHVGQSVEPPLITGSKYVSLHIIGMVPGPRSGGFAHFDYINRVGPFFGKNKVLMIQTRARTARDSEQLAARIQATFAHDFPTVKATTDALAQNAFARFGKVQQVLGFVMAMILLCAASVMVSALAHTAAQRRPVFALLQVLGFGRSTLIAATALEGALIIVIGAASGTGIGLVTTYFLARSTFLGQLFAAGGLNPPPWAYWLMLAWMTGLLIVALIAPVLRIQHVRAADYRNV